MAKVADGAVRCESCGAVVGSMAEAVARRWSWFTGYGKRTQHYCYTDTSGPLYTRSLAQSRIPPTARSRP